MGAAMNDTTRELGAGQTTGSRGTFLGCLGVQAAARKLRADLDQKKTLRALAEKVATPMRLRMLCLMTYADVRAVNPEALTPWKAENLWQLFIATSNWMDRNVDEERYHASVDPAVHQVGGALAQLRLELPSDVLQGRHGYLG